jgi:ankyrin repeat protein
LRVEELAEVLAIDFDAPAHGGIPQLNTNWRWADQHQAVLSTCSSLIAIVDDGDSRVVQFSHFSVKEYLTSDRLARSNRDVSQYYIALEPAHTIMAQACLGVLLRLDDHVNKSNASDIPLVKYAARHWFDHARFGKVASCIRDVMEYFFDADKPHWTAWCRVQEVDREWGLFEPEEEDATFPLYYASLGGFCDLAEHLVCKHPEHVDARGGQMVTPLVAALSGKHFQIAELLHRHDANIDVRDSDEDTPLNEACHAGLLETVEWLVNHGADVNAQGVSGWTSLHNAAYCGHVQTSQMLIKHNADVHLRDDIGRFPLHLAASDGKHRGHTEMMRLLLEHGADPNAQDGDGSTPLHHSSWEDPYEKKGTVEGTRLLLKHGATIDAEDNEGRTPLQLALDHERHDMVTCLKEHGATR